jgi:hypothetical protein
MKRRRVGQFESLEGRTLLSRGPRVAGPAQAQVARANAPGDLHGDGPVTPPDVSVLLAAYPSRRGEKKYNPAADLNHNGLVGQSDLRIYLHLVPPPTRPRPLKLDLHIDPKQEANFKHMPTTLGGHTFFKDITIIGRTTPGSFVVMDSGLGDYSFQGPAAYADARGLVKFPVENRDGINTYNFLVIDPFGNQVIRSFPVYWLSRAYQAH